MTIDERGIDFIKKMEGFSAIPYRDPAGVWTNGYGNTTGVTANSDSISEEEAEYQLEQNIAPCVRAVNESVAQQVCTPLTQSQFTALVDFAFNEGREALLTSELRTKLLAGNITGAAEEFGRWIYYHDHNEEGEEGPALVSEDLVKRRAAERELFLTPA